MGPHPINMMGRSNMIISDHLSNFDNDKLKIMDDLTATVIGATGLIGSQLVELLGKDEYFKKVRVVVRRSVSFNNPDVDIRIIDFNDTEAFRSALEGSSAVFCAVGTTQKKVKGDKTAYRKVDYEIPVHAAQFTAEAGCQCFLLVSSVGANSKSNNFYLRLKGEVEDKLRDIKINSINIFRPSMLLGDRQEFRAGEMLGKALAVPLSFLFPPDYRPVHGLNVAKAMIEAAKNKIPGFHVMHYRDILNLAVK
jgi:uncharacterized protein YbjT (DUF2867 family)